MVVILALDPGLAATGWAVVRGPASNPVLVASGTWRTRPTDAVPVRLHGLWDAVRQTVHDYAPLAAVVIEEPADVTVYARNERGRDSAKATRRGMDALRMALGALIVACPPSDTHLMRASRTAKAHKSLIGQRFAGDKRTSEHERDAIWLAVYALARPALTASP